MFIVLKGCIKKTAWLSEASWVNRRKKKAYTFIFSSSSPPLGRDEQGSMRSAYLREMDEVTREWREAAEKEE